MKKKCVVEKIVAMGLCAILCVPANLQTVHAEEAANAPVYTGYVEQDLKPADSIHQAGAPELLMEADPLPASYETSQLPDVRDQGEYGTCWAFSTLACIEIYLMNHSEEDLSAIDLSELHTAYFANFSVEDPLGGTTGDSYRYTSTECNYLEVGGNYDMAENVLSDWMGAVEETVVPYNTASDVLENGLSNTLAYGSDAYHLQGYRRISMTDRDDIKQAVKEYGAVGISYYASGSSSYFNDTYDSYYCGIQTSPNHAVTIVGWDDNFDKSKFSTSPSTNGAWLVRNSWGTGWGKDGYFYLSYEDKTIGSNGVVFIPESADNYKHNYQYDGAVWKKYVYLQKSANVFTATEAGGEKLEAVSFDTYSVNQDYTIEIYKNQTNSMDPETGELSATLTGTTDYEGMYTVKLDQPVYLEQGEKFAVVVSLVGQDGYGSIVADANATDTRGVYCNSGGTGKSLAYHDYWYDFGEEYDSNFHIKAYTNDVDPAEKVSVTGVTLSDQQITLQKGKTGTLVAAVAPENATNRSVKWSSSNESVATVDNSGRVTAVSVGEAVITASTVDGDYSASCAITVTDILLQKITLNWTKMSMDKGDSSQLQVTYTPGDTTEDKTVTWSSSNPSVATVDSTGKVTAVSAGKAVITAKVGSCTATCDITVTVPQSSGGSDSGTGSSAGITEQQTGWVSEGGNWYYVNTDGENATGWVNDGGTWYYMNPSGTMATGWVNDGGTWYYMNPSGAMATGWVNDGGIWYYMNPSGAMATGWVNDGGIWYYMNPSGAMATGWVNDGGIWYYMNPSGAMATGWVYSGGKWYYMNSSGAMATGWVYSGGKWYYMKSSGAMATGWLYTGGHWYYLYSDGSMAVNTKIGRYRIGADGVWK